MRELYVACILMIIDVLLLGYMTRESFQTLGEIRKEYQQNLKYKFGLLKTARQQADLLKEKISTRREIRQELNEEYKKGMCESVPRFETVNPKKLSTGRHQDDSLIVQKEFVPGVWYSESNLCQNPVLSENTGVCDTHAIECAHHEFDGLTTSIGRNSSNDPGICVFDNCPIYCARYGDSCTRVITKPSGTYYFETTNSRGECVDPVNNTAECVEPVAENCPKSEFYYYAEDNSTILKGERLPSVDSNMCVYTDTIAQPPIFDTLEDAQRNCEGFDLTTDCYTESAPGSYLRTTHHLLRSNCTYTDYPSSGCRSKDSLLCTNVETYFKPYSEQHGGVNGNYVKEYLPFEVRDRMVDVSNGVECVSTKPPGSLDMNDIRASCKAACMSNGTMVVKEGDVYGYSCVVPNCYEEPMLAGQCPSREYYAFDIDNLTIVSNPMDVSVVNNACEYTFPANVEGPLYETESAARSNCLGMQLHKACYYSSNQTMYLHELDRETCTYPERGVDCIENINAGDPCGGSTTFYTVSDEVERYANGLATKEITSMEVPNVFKSIDGVMFECATGIPPAGYVLEPSCEIPCNTGTRRGLIEEEMCSVSGCT